MRFFKVNIIESERGWGSKVDSTRYFIDLAKANAFVTEYNSHNTALTAPDWYMRADLAQTIDIPTELIKLILENLPEDIRKEMGVTIRKKKAAKKKAPKSKNA
jgi:hypothetical protein